MTIDLDEDESLPLRELRRLVGGQCHGCGLRYGPHDVVFSVALGFKTAPRCLPCLAAGFDRPQQEFRAELLNYVQRRECYLRAWEEAERMTHADTPTPSTAETAAPPVDDPATSVAEWDAGDMGCGELVLALRIRLIALPSGAVLAVRATDPAAPEDLPAWCGLTGHKLLSANHPRYLIRRK
jgi:tRNA 2-thiouridine synthesizing protein A